MIDLRKVRVITRTSKSDTLRHWRQKIKQHRLIIAFIIVAGVLLTALIVVVILGYLLNWPGVGVNGGYSKITTTGTTKGITTTIEQPLTKTLWDWMQLLIVPLVLAIGVFWLNQIQKSSSRLSTSMGRCGGTGGLRAMCISPRMRCGLLEGKGESTRPM